MTVFTKEQLDNDEFPMKDLETNECFLCGGDFFTDDNRSTGAIVVWAGITGYIGLHQPCAEKLGVNLLQDARSAATITGKRAKLRHETPSNDGSWYTKSK